MRQAGRSLPEYRALRGSGSILDAIMDPTTACEITLQPVRRYGVDAAILFSDIVTPYHAIGFGVDVVPGRGPVIADPFRDERDLLRLRNVTDDDLAHVTDTVDRVITELDASDTPLIGFAGAPFTIASYLVEGAPTRTFEVVTTFMRERGDLWTALCERLVAITTDFLRAQVQHGARALQLFDSWAGFLSTADYERYALPATKQIFDNLADLAVPTILFGVSTGHLLPAMATAGSTVVGIDYHQSLAVGRRLVGDKPVQGNLDPHVILDGVEVARAATRDVLHAAGTAPGHIFNLGHGVLPASDPDVLKAVVDLVHEEGKAGVR
jgi:uroporphyrinogen decarboxylase